MNPNEARSSEQSRDSLAAAVRDCGPRPSSSLHKASELMDETWAELHHGHRQYIAPSHLNDHSASAPAWLVPAMAAACAVILYFALRGLA